ncbi:MAG: hypothetical protein ABIE84_03110 [bacterium]
MKVEGKPSLTRLPSFSSLAELARTAATRRMKSVGKAVISNEFIDKFIRDLAEAAGSMEKLVDLIKTHGPLKYLEIALSKTSPILEKYDLPSLFDFLKIVLTLSASTFNSLPPEEVTLQIANNVATIRQHDLMKRQAMCDNLRVLAPCFSHLSEEFGQALITIAEQVEQQQRQNSCQ